MKQVAGILRMAFIIGFFIWGGVCRPLVLEADEDDPFSWDNYQWRSLNGPWAAFISGILLDPADPNHLLISTKLGVYHSFNHGASWIRRSAGIPFGICPTHFRYHPEQSGVIIATGSGPFHENSTVLKSMDNGLTWTDLNLRLALKDAIIPSAYPDRIIAGGISGVFLSTDNGASWWCKDNEHIFLEFSENEAEPGIIYASVDRGDLAISEDGGETWIFKTHGRSGNQDNKPTISYGGITVIPGTPPAILTCWNWMGGENVGQVFKTDDKGDTWALVLEAPINRVRHAPSNPSVIWAGGGISPYGTSDPSFIFVSTDTGSTWTDISGTQLGSVSALQIDPTNSQTVYMGKVQNGLFKTTDGGQTWISSKKYLANVRCFDLALQHGGDDLICVSDSLSGLTLTDKQGHTWSYLDSFPEKSYVSVAFKPDNPDILLAGYSTVYYSSDTGNTWDITNMYGQSIIDSIVYHETQPDYCYVPRTSFSDSWGLWMSSNGGQLWSYIYQDASGTVVEPDYFDPMRIFLAVTSGPTRGFMRSTDGGNTWTNIQDIQVARAICSDPLHQDVFYINAYSSPIAKTTDGGNTWETGLAQEISGLINRILISPQTGRLFIAGETGFWYSDDGGYTWTNQNRGLIDKNLMQIEIRMEDGIESYYVGTAEAGLWKWMPIDDEAPDVTLTAPASGTVLAAGSVVPIDWNESDNEHIQMRDIFLSTDSGTTWSIVIAGSLDDGPPYSWMVPNIASSHCRIKIVVYDPSWNKAQDAMTADFTIIGDTTTPTPTPTATASPPPTPTPQPLSIEISMPAHHFTAGSPCYLKADIHNRETFIPNAPVFILLDVYGDFWMAPSWGHYPETFDHYTYSLPLGLTEIIVIPEFTWPDNTGSAAELYFFAFITTPDYTQLLSNLAEWEFGYSS